MFKVGDKVRFNNENKCYGRGEYIIVRIEGIPDNPNSLCWIRNDILDEDGGYYLGRFEKAKNDNTRNY